MTTTPSFISIMTDLHRLVRDAIDSRPTFPSRDTILALIDDAIDSYCDNPATTDATKSEYRAALIHHYNI